MMAQLNDEERSELRGVASGLREEWHEVVEAIGDVLVPVGLVLRFEGSMIRLWELVDKAFPCGALGGPSPESEE